MFFFFVKGEKLVEHFSKFEIIIGFVNIFSFGMKQVKFMSG